MTATMTTSQHESVEQCLVSDQKLQLQKRKQKPDVNNTVLMAVFISAFGKNSCLLGKAEPTSCFTVVVLYKHKFHL